MDEASKESHTTEPSGLEAAFRILQDRNSTDLEIEWAAGRFLYCVSNLARSLSRSTIGRITAPDLLVTICTEAVEDTVFLILSGDIEFRSDSKLEKYLMKAAHHKAYNLQSRSPHYRNLSLDQLIEDSNFQIATHEQGFSLVEVEQSELDRLVKQAKLTNRERVVLSGLVMGLKPQQIATTTGLTPSRVSRVLWDARHKLREARRALDRSMKDESSLLYPSEGP